MATCPKCLREAWQTRSLTVGGIVVDPPDICSKQGGQDCLIAAAGGAAAIRAERAREAELTHPQLVESLYAERDAARSALSDAIAERDGLQSMLTQVGRGYEAVRNSITTGCPRCTAPTDPALSPTMWCFIDSLVERAAAVERMKCATEIAALKLALQCPGSDLGTHRCVRCDSEVE